MYTRIEVFDKIDEIFLHGETALVKIVRIVLFFKRWHQGTVHKVEQ